MNSIILFIQEKISEYQIVSFLQDYIGIKIDSNETNNKNNKSFLQYINYETEFTTLIGLSSLEITLEDKDIAKAISLRFKTQTIIELSEPVNRFDYLLINENGDERLINIIESEKGITIKNT